MEQEGLIHRRLVCDTSTFFEELRILGFKEISSKGSGIKQIREFQKGNKFVHNTFENMKLFTKDSEGKETISHEGKTVHDDLLKFFATRNPIPPPL